MRCKGIILAGGFGSRLYPITKVYSKQLVAVYDKPLLYYPLTTLIECGINEILIITDKDTLPLYKQLFNNSDLAGLNLNFALQHKPNGIAEAFIIAEEFIGNDNVCLILGDNIFYGVDNCFYDIIHNPLKDKTSNYIFALQVKHPSHYGVVRFSSDNQPIEIVEKPATFISYYAVPGIYFYDNDVISIAKSLQPSKRNELEITDVNNILLKQNKLNVSVLNNSVTWLDCGTPKSLLEASNFIASIEERHNKKIGCYEEAAYRMGLINKEQLLSLSNNLPECNYKEYLSNIGRGN